MKTSKTILLTGIILISGFSSVAFAQNLTSADIPAAINTTFKTQFPKAERITWEKNGATYQAFFTSDNGKKTVAEFNNSGVLLKNNHEINYNELPAPVQQTITSQYAGFTHHKVRQLESPSAVTMYEVTLMKGKELNVVKLSAQGKVL